jgi:hypothetical protein
MKYLLITFLFFSSLNAQEYLNSDGTLSPQYYRDLCLAAFKGIETDDNKFEIEDNFFVIISKSECDASVLPTELQQKAMAACFLQLIARIHGFQSRGFENFEKAEFSGMIFKTNYVCSLETRRYHFKFSLKELQNFPEYIDLEELLTYIGSNNNIVFVKNPK